MDDVPPVQPMTLLLDHVVVANPEVGPQVAHDLPVRLNRLVAPIRIPTGVPRARGVDCARRTGSLDTRLEGLEKLCGERVDGRVRQQLPPLVARGGGFPPAPAGVVLWLERWHTPQSEPIIPHGQ